MDQNKKTLETYEKIATTYAFINNGNKQMEHFHSLFSTFLPNGLVYDIGCGTGRDAKALSELGYKVIGIDGSKKMLEGAVEYFPNGSFQLLNLLCDIHLLKSSETLYT